MLGVILACSLALVFVVYSFAEKKKVTETGSSENVKSSNQCAKTSENGEADIIIVGAGVAGAALAYTLGKV